MTSGGRWKKPMQCKTDEAALPILKNKYVFAQKRRSKIYVLISSFSKSSSKPAFFKAPLQGIQKLLPSVHPYPASLVISMRMPLYPTMLLERTRALLYTVEQHLKEKLCLKNDIFPNKNRKLICTLFGFPPCGVASSPLGIQCT